MAVEIGFKASVVLSTLPKPTIAFVIPETVPVKVGEAIGAFKLIRADSEAVSALASFKSKADWVAVEIGFKASVVLSTFESPTFALSIPDAILTFVTFASAIIPVTTLLVPMVVALPTLVTSPVKLAFVTTVVALPLEVTMPVKLALVVTVPAVNPAAVPDILVPTSAMGVPNAGVIKVGEVALTTLPEPVVEISSTTPAPTDTLPKTLSVAETSWILA